MKIVNLKKYTKLLFITLSLSIGFSSCSDYLDIVPPEQATLPDAVKDYDNTLKFLYSCYGYVDDVNPMHYSVVESASDEWVLPPLWRETQHQILYGLVSPTNVVDNRWYGYYTAIGQCYLFLNQLPNARDVSDEDKREFEAEAHFMIAYYHMQLLLYYGPCPIIEGYMKADTPDTEFPGRYHFDYAVDWVVKKFDQVSEVLPANRANEKWGRATSTMAKALKAKLLLFAASPLWNGEFPYPEWKNKNFETPGYGKELVSLTKDMSKWEKAKQAAQEALTHATSAGHALYTDEEHYKKESLELPYVPGVDKSSAEGQKFLKKVLLMRYLVTTRSTEGNKEIIWGLANQGNMIVGSLPHHIIKRKNGTNVGAYSGVSPILNTSIHYFYTNKGKRPEHDSQFAQSGEWYKSAGNLGNDRKDIIKLNVNREPRFYAWFAFDGGDMGSKLVNGKPIKIDVKNPETHGFNPDRFNRDNNVTGYFSQKFINPRHLYNENGGQENTESKPRPLMRLAELYLNLAECQAALGETQNAIDNLNIIRRRAGVPELTATDVTGNFTITDWVRNERFIELWGEGHRYHDVRRWMIAPETMAAGKRLGLSAYGKKAPSFEEFNTVIPIQQNFLWSNRMYLLPVHRDEVYKNPQMVQAPGY